MGPRLWLLLGLLGLLLLLLETPEARTFNLALVWDNDDTSMLAVVTYALQIANEKLLAGKHRLELSKELNLDALCSESGGLIAGRTIKEKFDSSLIAVVGASCSDSSHALSREVESLGLPVISYGATSSLEFPENFFRVVLPESVAVGRMFELLQKLSWQNFAVVGATTRYSTSVISLLSDLSDERGHRMVPEQWSPASNASAIRAALRRIKRDGIRVIVLLTLAGETSVLLDIAAEEGLYGNETVYILPLGSSKSIPGLWLEPYNPVAQQVLEGCIKITYKLTENPLSHELEAIVAPRDYFLVRHLNWYKHLFDAVVSVALAIRDAELRGFDENAPHAAVMAELPRMQFAGASGEVRLGQEKLVSLDILLHQNGMITRVGQADDIFPLQLSSRVLEYSKRIDARVMTICYLKSAVSDAVSGIVGAQFAIREANALAGSRHFKLLDQFPADDCNDGQIARTIAKIRKLQPDVIVSQTCSRTTEPILVGIRDLGIPFLGFYAGALELADVEKYPHFIRFRLDATVFSRVKHAWLRLFGWQANYQARERT